MSKSVKFDSEIHFLNGSGIQGQEQFYDHLH